MSYEDALDADYSRFTGYDPEEIDSEVQDLHKLYDWNGFVEVRFIDSEEYEISWKPEGVDLPMYFYRVDHFETALEKRLGVRE